MSETGPYERHYAYPLVTWGSTLLGAVVALITAFMLNILGASLGITVIAIGQSPAAAAGAGIIGIVWIVIANLIALGFGAWVAGRSTANPDHHGGTLQGIAVWAVTSLAVLLVAGSALSGTAGRGTQTEVIQIPQTSSVQPAGSLANTGGVTAPAMTQQEASAFHTAAVQAASGAAMATFGTFLAMALGLIAAIIGARSGARHPGWADRPRFTYVERRH